MSEQRTTFVLDTSVLLSVGSAALFAFPDSEVVIPLAVVRELEKQRNDETLGFVARGVLRFLEELRSEYGNTLGSGVPTGKDNGATIRIEVNHIERSTLPESVRNSSTDTAILAVAYNLQAEGNKVVLVTNDLPLRIIAQIGVKMNAREFTLPQLNQGDFSGIVTASARDDQVADIYRHEQGEAYALEYGDVSFHEEPEAANIGVILEGSGGSHALARGGDDGIIEKVKTHEPFGVKGRSAAQKLALDYLMDDSIQVVSLGGRAGTGKTMLALAAGMDQVLELRTYSRVVVFRPLLAVGNQSLGFLPGDADEKMAPWAAAVYDAVDAITGQNKNLAEAIASNKMLEVLPITHVRGRTLSNSFIIIDEAQNLERNVLLSILSRVGEGTKVVLCWDAAQRDNLHISRNDGIVALVNRLKEYPMFAHVTFTKSERSVVASIASEILEDMS